MCTLVVHVSGDPPGSRLLLGANRDEAYDRGSEGPALLSMAPRVWGGRDLEARGTWLCARLDAPYALVAVLNRPPVGGGDPHAAAPPSRRSRGLLCLEAARDGTLAGARREVERQVNQHGSAPFNLFFASIAATVLSYDGERSGICGLWNGWHAITHGEPDDPEDERVTQALAALSDDDRSLEALAAVLARHDGPGAACRHGDRYGTVSSTIVDADLVAGRFEWRYAAGPPCRTAYTLTNPPA